MATILEWKDKGGNVAWRAVILVRGKIRYQSFPLKSEAENWANAQEAKFAELGVCVRPILDVQVDASVKKTLGHIFNRYVREVSPKKIGYKWERDRLYAWIRSPLADVALEELGPEHIAAWRDARLKVVTASTVRREMGLLGSVLELARREWRWIKINPARDVRKPPEARHRTQRISPQDLEKLLAALSYVPGTIPTRLSHETAIALLLALETAMRSGEILAITKGNVHLDKSYVHLPNTKNGTSRDVPLSKKAKDLLRLLVGEYLRPGDRIFTISANTRQTQFRNAKIKAGLQHIRFHDSRREATTCLSKIFAPLDLAKITGHKKLDMLLVYYEQSATELAEKMNNAVNGNT